VHRLRKRLPASYDKSKWLNAQQVRAVGGKRSLILRAGNTLQTLPVQATSTSKAKKDSHPHKRTRKVKRGSTVSRKQRKLKDWEEKLLGELSGEEVWSTS